MVQFVELIWSVKVKVYLVKLEQKFVEVYFCIFKFAINSSGGEGGVAITNHIAINY